MIIYRAITTFLLPLTAFLIAGASSCASAQDDGSDQTANSSKKRLEAQLVESKRIFDLEMSLQIKEMERVCKLSKSQVGGLKVAAKGATDRLVAYTKIVCEKILETYDSGIPTQVEGLKQELEAAGFNLEDFGVSDSRTLDIVLSVSPTQTKRWTANADKILTKDQAITYAAFVEARKKRKRASAVNAFMVGVEERLRLSPEQMKELTAWVDNNYGDFIAKENAGYSYFRIYENPLYLVRGFVQKVPPLNNSALDAILSKAQVDLWNKKIAPAFEKARRDFDSE